MNIDQELALLQIVQDDFLNMKEFLDIIQRKIGDKSAIVQLDFIKPLKHMLTEMLFDTGDPDDSFLNQETENIEV